MPAKFTTHIREFIASALLTSVESQRTSEWATSTGYSIGNKVTSNGNLYVAATSGTSGVSAPSHISGTASDGGVDWIYVEAAVSDKLFEANMYLGIGRPADWPVPTSPDNVVAIDSVETAALNNIVSLKSVKPGNMKACASRHNWTSGSVYSQYDSKIEFEDYTNPFFVITDENNIYKCLDNFNGAQSTSKPTNYQTVPFRTADGYVWKYMGSVDSADSAIFMTDDFIPVSVKKSADQGPNQWAVQLAAQQNSISTFKIFGAVGAFTATPVVTIYGEGSSAVAAAHKTATTVDQVYVTNPGTGYVEDTTYAFVTDGVGAGSGAAATAVINPTTGEITGITIDNGGSGYTGGAVAFIVGTPKTGMTLTEPTAVSVTVASGIVTGITLTGATANYESARVFIVPGSSGALALPVMAPASGHGANIVRELGASTVMISVKLTNTVNDTGYFLIDAGSEFHQVTIVTDIVDFTSDKYASGNLYIGPAHPNYATPGALSKMKSGVGVVLYINNIKTVIREVDQEEDIKVAITL